MRGRAPSRFDRRTILGFVVSAIALAGCVWWASKQDAPKFPDGAEEWGLLVLGLLIYAAITVVRGWRWDVILRFIEVRHQRTDAYALTVVGYMGNTVLPARGGEVLRVFLLAERSDARRREVLGSIVTERLLDALGLIAIFLLVAFTGLGEAPGGSLTAVLALVAVVLGVGGPIVYLRLRQAGRFETFADKIRPLARASRQLFSVRGVLLLVVTMGAWISEAVIFWLCAQSLGIGIGVLDGLTVTVLASLSALIPAGPGYIGTYDAAALFALHELDVTGGAAFSCIILFRFVVFVPITVVGLVLMLVRYGGLREALRREYAAA